MSLSRRDFLGAMAAIPALEAGRTEPELLLHNGNFVTMDARQPRAQAVADRKSVV